MKNGFKVIDIEHHYDTPRMMKYWNQFYADSDFLTNEQKQALLYDNAHALGFGK